MSFALSPSPEGPQLVVRALAAQRGDRPLFAGLDLMLTAGDGLWVRGHNGVGKTTLLRLLAGLSQPLHGEVTWRGRSLRDALEEWPGDLLYIGHRHGHKEILSCLENLTFQLALIGAPHDEPHCLAALDAVGLGHLADLPVRSLSQGQQRRLALARLFAGHATLWILDEPFTALDRHACRWVEARLDEHLARGGVAVVTSHQPLATTRTLRELDLEALA